MQLKAFTIYDSAVEAYLRPFFCLSDGEAVRTFSDAVNDANSPFHRHPGDFTLYGIGTFDDTLGVLDKAPPENLGCALIFIIEGKTHAE